MATKPNVIYRDASVVTARPIVPGPILEPVPPDAFTSGSQINQAAVGGPYEATEIGSGSSLNKAQAGSWWTSIIDGAIKFFVGWRPNNYREIAHHNVAGNYGSKSSVANYGFLASFAFPTSGGTSYAGYPNEAIPTDPSAPTWNNLIPIIYGLRVVNPVAGGSFDSTTQAAKVVSQFTESVEYTPPGVASLSMKGEVLA